MPVVNFQLRHTSGWVYHGTTKQTLAARLADLWRQSTRPLTTRQTKVKELLELMKRTKKDEWTISAVQEQKDELKEEEEQLTGVELSEEKEQVAVAVVKPSPPSKQAFVYLLEHTSGKRYVGSTTSLKARLKQHWQEATGPTSKPVHTRPLLELMRQTKPEEWKMSVLKDVPAGELATEHEYRAMREFQDAELLNVNRGTDLDLVLNYEHVSQLGTIVEREDEHMALMEKHARANFDASTFPVLTDSEKDSFVHCIKLAHTLTTKQWERIAYYEEARLAESTQRAYKGVMKAFTEFWASRFSHVHPDQCTDAEVRLFLTEGADEGLSNSTLELRLACLQGHLKTLSDEQWQRVHDCVISIRKRRAGDPRFESKGKDALLTADLKVCLATIQGDGLLDVRNRSLLLLMWFSAMRRSEVSALCWRHLTCKDNGVVIRISKAKADQQGFGQDVEIAAKPDEPNRCPLRALLAWRDLLKPEPNDPVFPHINVYTHELARQTPMGGDRIYRLVKETCAAAGLDPQRFAPHSFRSGLLTQSATNGVAIEKLKAHARHSHCNTTLKYVRASEILGPDCLTNKV